MSNPPYRNEIILFGKRVVHFIRKKWETYPICVHFRVGDAHFAEDYEKTLETVTSQVLSSTSYAPNRPIIFITDATEERKEKALLDFRTFFSRVYTIGDFGSFRRKVDKELGFPLGILHYEQILCACTSGFVGHPNSTFSQRIAYMMETKICNRVKL